MHGEAEISELTSRVRSLTLTADNAGDDRAQGLGWALAEHHPGLGYNDFSA